jgi:hypothetical protein
MLEIHNNAPDDWGSAHIERNYQPKTLYVTKENKSIYLTAVWIRGLTILFSMTGIIGIAYLSKDIPQALITLGSIAVGALGSLFTHSK